KLLQSFMDLSESCHRAGEEGPAADAYRHAQALGPQVMAARPSDRVARLLIAAHINCGTLFAVNGRYDEALACLQQSSVVLDRLPGFGALTRAARVGMVRNLGLLASDFLQQKKPDRAAACYRLVIEQHRKLADEQPTALGHRHNLAVSHLKLAHHFRKF